MTEGRGVRRGIPSRLRPGVSRAIGVITAAATGVALGHSAARHRPVPTFAAAVAAAVGADPAAAHGAWAVVQAHDCAGLVGALASASRAARAAGASLRVVVPGNVAHADSVRRLLSASGLPLPVASGGPELPRAVRALGFRTTPVLVSLGADGAVRFASAFPSDPEALVRWHALPPAVFAP